MYKVLVSACLLGQNVRYDGRNNLINHPIIDQLKAENRLVADCPEVSGGLSIPRPYAHIKQRIPIEVINAEGDDVTPEFLLGAERVAEKARTEGCVAALMKSQSPSCGNRDIEAVSFSGVVKSGAGLAAQELLSAGIPVFNEHELDSLQALLAQFEGEALSV